MEATGKTYENNAESLPFVLLNVANIAHVRAYLIFSSFRRKTFIFIRNVTCMRVGQLKRVWETGRTCKTLVSRPGWWLCEKTWEQKQRLSSRFETCVYILVFIYKSIDARLKQFYTAKEWRDKSLLLCLWFKFAVAQYFEKKRKWKMLLLSILSLLRHPKGDSEDLQFQKY